jgi:folate-binding Fe-S cluster repair protein YgfZ
MPAEAGLVERAVSFTKGCYVGQEPVARLHYRGHANRGLRALLLDAQVPPAGAAVVLEEREVGRVTSATDSPSLGRPVALAIMRREVDDGARVQVRWDDGESAAQVAPLPPYSWRERA